jgi:RNA polymerase sigma-70 factor (ECF subfamily)
MIAPLVRPHLCGVAHYSTDELMLLVQRGDGLAFEELYRRMVPTLNRFLASRPEGKVGVEDAIQETFCRLWQDPGGFAGRSSATTYLLRIALNVARENHRQNARATAWSNADSDTLLYTLPTQELDLSELATAARACLSNEQAAAVELVHGTGMNVSEAARQLACSVKAVQRRLERAYAAMRRELQRS